MSLELDKILGVDLNYPGISFAFESWALGEYLKVMEEHLSFAQDQFLLRSQQDINRRRSMLVSAEIEHRLKEINELAEFQIPRFFRMTALVAIWGCFESFVSDIANYVARREGLNVSLRDIRAANVRDQIEKLFEGIMHIDLPWQTGERYRLANLQLLRHYAAHENGRVADFDPDGKTPINKLLENENKNGKRITIDNGVLIVEAEYIAESATLVTEMLCKLNELVARRYKGPAVAPG